MNRCMLYHAVFATLVSLVSLANAQEPAAETKPAEQPEAVPAALEERYQQMAEQLKQELPKREINFQVVEAQKTPLFRADPKLFENKFVGRLELRPAGVDFATQTSARDRTERLRFDRNEMRKYPIELQQLLFVGKMSLLHVGLDRSNFLLGFVFDEGKQQASDRFHLLLKQCAPELAPEKELMDFLTSADCNRDVVPRIQDFRIRSRDDSFSAIQQQLTYQIFAPTADEVEKRARAIVRLYDAGLSRPMQQYLLGQGQKAMETVRSQYVEMAQLTKALSAEDEKLVKPSEISGDILSQLKAQKVMVAVELAGLNARVKACDAMLTDPKKLEIAALQSISDMKVKAEIERVGIKEKLDQINIFIAEGDSRTAARSRRSVLRSKADGLKDGIHLSEQSATQYAELFALYAPFQIPDNQITVGPIEWTQQ